MIGNSFSRSYSASQYKTAQQCCRRRESSQAVRAGPFGVLGGRGFQLCDARVEVGGMASMLSRRPQEHSATRARGRDGGRDSRKSRRVSGCEIRGFVSQLTGGAYSRQGSPGRSNPTRQVKRGGLRDPGHGSERSSGVDKCDDSLSEGSTGCHGTDPAAAVVAALVLP